MVVPNYAPAYTWERPIADVMARAGAFVQLHIENLEIELHIENIQLDFYLAPGNARSSTALQKLFNRFTAKKSIATIFNEWLTIVRYNHFSPKKSEHLWRSVVS